MSPACQCAHSQHHEVLSFHAGELNTFDKVALRKEEKQKHRHHAHHRCGDQPVVVDRAVLIAEEVQPNRHREQFRAAQVNQRLKEAVPRPPEREDDHRRNRWFAQRHEHIPDDPHRRSAVDTRRFFQFARDRREELPQHKDQEGVAKERADEQRPQRVDHIEVAENLVHRALVSPGRAASSYPAE